MARRSKSSRERIEPVIGAKFGHSRRGDLDIQLHDGERSASLKKQKKSHARRTRKMDKRQKGRKRNGSSGGGAFKFITRSLYWGTVLGLWGMIAVVGILGYYTAKLPHSGSWTIPDRPPNVRIVAVDGSLIGHRGLTGGEAVPIHSMPAYLPDAIVAIEDHRFYNHFGFDIIGFGRAMATNILKGRLAQGGSSLTQQLAKNLFLKPERTVERKIQELVLAFWLESQYSKDEILELYLNRVYFGANAYGVDAASRRYFKKSAREINLGEAAILAGLVKAPSRLAPSKNPEAARKRAKLVLAAMEREGFISAHEREIALTQQSAEVAKRKTGSHNYIADWVMNVLPSYVGEITEDVIVETTIDGHLQRFAQEAIATGLTENSEKLGVTQGALVSVDGIGAVRAMIGGRDYGESQFNRAVKAKRQPGSSFKPFVYLAAMEYGMTPDTVRSDKPISINGWKPKNYSKEYEGPVKLRRALARSLNTIAATLANEVGPQSVVDVAHRLGIKSELTANPSISLGTSEVTPFELATAYVAFANGGFRVDPFIVKRVTSRDGKVLYDQESERNYLRVIDPKHLGMMNVMMTETLVYGTGKRATLKDWPAGGKTGTSQNFRDAWFAGFTSNLTTVVWFGNDDNSPTNRASGGNLPAQIWKRFMREAHQGVPVANLPGSYDGKILAGNLPQDIDNTTTRTTGPQVVKANEKRGIKRLLGKIFGKN